MAVTFAYRGGSLNARYAPGGGIGRAFGVTVPNLTNPALTGQLSATVLNFNSTTLYQGVMWPGGLNLSPNKAFSVLYRMAYIQTGVGTMTLGSWLGPNTNDYNHFISQVVNSAGNYNWQCEFTGVGNGYTFFGMNSFSAAETSPDTTTFHDFVITWDGTTTAAKLKFWKDGTSVGTRTATTIVPTYDRNLYTNIILGNANGTENQTAKFYMDEMVIFDAVVDPSVGVTLTDGSVHPLNGSSRTLYVDAAAYNGIGNGLLTRSPLVG